MDSNLFKKPKALTVIDPVERVAGSQRLGLKNLNNSDPSVQEMNLIYLQSMAQQKKLSNKGKTIECPYPCMFYSLETDVYEKDKAMCSVGPGPWCKVCSRHIRHLKQRDLNPKAYVEKIKKDAKAIVETGLAPSVRARKMEEGKPVLH